MSNNILPYLCTPQNIYEGFFRKELGINAVYSLFHQADFPKVIIGKKFFVTRPAFLEWWERQEKTDGRAS